MLVQFKKTKLLASAVIMLSCASASAAPGLAGAMGTLNNIDSALNDAAVKAERMFEENHGKIMRSHYDVIKPGSNPYISVLRVSRDYKVELQFAGSTKRGAKNTSVPVAKALLGTDIVLVPVYNKNDEKITTFECLTNADREVQEFMGSSGTKEYTASYIRDYTDNKYLSLCTYMNRDLVRGPSGGPSRGPSKDR